VVHDNVRARARARSPLSRTAHQSPQRGRFGQIVAKVLGRDPSAEVHEGLRDFKRFMETGEKPTTEGQPRGTCDGAGTRG
jgi:hypothetical protein